MQHIYGQHDGSIMLHEVTVMKECNVVVTRLSLGVHGLQCCQRRHEGRPENTRLPAAVSLFRRVLSATGLRGPRGVARHTTPPPKRRQSPKRRDETRK